jgi:hypothetical protein
MFEPTDLEMETAGTAELDVQVGAYQGDVARLVVPDLEFDLGLLPGLELDVDSAYTIQGPEDGRFAFTNPTPDNIWVASKLALWDSRLEGGASAWALGLQVGPKFPMAKDLHGLGYEGLLLVGRASNRSHLVINLGGLVDPGTNISHNRAIGVEGGLDAELELQLAHLSVTGELGGVRYLSSDPHELHATLGLNWGVTNTLDVSLVGLVGFLSGGDHAGVLLGVSPKFALW